MYELLRNAMWLADNSGNTSPRLHAWRSHRRRLEKHGTECLESTLPLAWESMASFAIVSESTSPETFALDTVVCTGQLAAGGGAAEGDATTLIFRWAQSPTASDLYAMRINPSIWHSGITQESTISHVEILTTRPTDATVPVTFFATSPAEDRSEARGYTVLFWTAAGVSTITILTLPTASAVHITSVTICAPTGVGNWLLLNGVRRGKWFATQNAQPIFESKPTGPNVRSAAVPIGQLAKAA